jgi:5-methylcytosine-specific restriction endonuclease McrA|tara:strand:- start:14326 stop:14865 length:540 start_codon:yes stop_codon:yes gene_type:complete
MSNDTLLLNANGAPLCVTPLSTLSWQESIKLIWLDKINVLEWHDWEVHSVNHSMQVPSVITVKEYVPQAGAVNFTRTNVFIRDRYTCQYCFCSFKKSDLTLDHVLPRSKGGRTNWLNIVTACKKCNHSKGNNAKITPKQMPTRPNFYHMYGSKNFTLSIKHQIWLKYIDWPEEHIRMVA